MLRPYREEPPHQGSFDCECYTCEAVREHMYVSHEHERLFSLLAAFLRVVPLARSCNPEKLRAVLAKMNNIVCTRMAYHKVEPQAAVSLRVLTAVEAIHERLGQGGDHRDDYLALEFVEQAAQMGTRKSTLLTAVTDKTWQEQIAGRARLAIKRDWPELDLR